MRPLFSALPSVETRLRGFACRSALAGAMIVFSFSPSSAQWIGAPGGSGDAASAPPPSLPEPAQAAPGFSPGPAMGMPQQSAPVSDCQTQVTKLRGDLETRGGALEKAAKGKRPPSELCPLFRNFASAQQRFYNYLNTNKDACGVPDNVLTQIKENLAQVSSTRNKVCDVAKMQESGGGAGPGGPPAQGAISAGLGLSSGLPTGGAPPGGVFDTLGGDALR